MPERADLDSLTQSYDEREEGAMDSVLSRRRLLQRTAATGLGLAVGAGVTSLARAPRARGADGEPVSLSLWSPSYWKGRTGTEADGRSTDYYEWEIARFQETHPNVTITYTETPSTTEGAAKYDTAVASGNAPDIMYLVSDKQWTYAPQDALEPIEPYLDAAFVDDWLPAAQNMTAYPDGHQYHWPACMAVAGGVFVNLDLADRFGATELVPSDPDRAWTPETFRDFVVACTKEGVYGTAFMTDWVYQVNQFFFGFGANFYDEFETKVLINSEEGVAALQFLVDLQNVQQAAVPGTAGRTNDVVLRMFRQQEIAVYPSQPYYITAFRSQPEFQTDFRWTFVQPPAQEGKMAAEANLQGFFVAKQSDPAKRDAAMAFCAQMCSPESLEIRTNAQGVIAARESLLSILEGDPDRYVEGLIAANAQPFGRLYGEIQSKVWTPNLDAAFSGAKTVRQALDDTAADSNELIAEAGEEFGWPMPAA
jgi:multiple sugar transport system substrate-binding protein